jgi:anthranilate/para-aminobenzoate synthase component II
MASWVEHDGSGLFAGLPNPLSVGRYHSLVAMPAPQGPLRVTARSLDDNEVMAVTHTDHPTHGLQFHPESVLSPQGRAMMDSFVAQVR